MTHTEHVHLLFGIGLALTGILWLGAQSYPAGCGYIGGTLKILLADDDRVLTTLLSTRLRARGVETVVAHDAMQALMTAMRSPPDAIVLDVQMPGGTGIEALRKLKASSKTATIPVLVVSGSGSNETPDQVKGLGADDFLLKPIDPETLYQALCRALGKPEPEG